MNLNYGIEGMLIKRGMVFLLDMTGMGAIGSEQGESVNGSKLRPCVVIQNNIGNKFSPTVVVALITSKMTKANIPTHVKLDKEMGLDANSIVMLEQIKTVDKQRLVKFCCKLDREKISEIDRAMNISLGQLNVREENVLKQVDEVKYLIRNIDDLMDDLYSSKNQIRQRVIRLNCEYNKLKRMCEENGLYIGNYIVLDEIKYLSMLKDERRYATL